jgi:hypothetical protein
MDVPSPLDELVVHEERPAYVIASLSGLLFQIYRTETPTEAARTAERVAADIVTAGQEPRGLFIVTHAGASAPQGEAREILARLGTRMKGARGCAFVSKGSGFGASMMRSILTGMVLLARPDFPVKLFSETSPAVDWLASELQLPDRSVLRAALRQLGE